MWTFLYKTIISSFPKQHSFPSSTETSQKWNLSQFLSPAISSRKLRFRHHRFPPLSGEQSETTTPLASLLGPNTISCARNTWANYFLCLSVRRWRCWKKPGLEGCQHTSADWSLDEGMNEFSVVWNVVGGLVFDLDGWRRAAVWGGRFERKKEINKWFMGLRKWDCVMLGVVVTGLFDLLRWSYRHRAWFGEGIKLHHKLNNLWKHIGRADDGNEAHLLSRSYVMISFGFPFLM